MLDSQGGGYTYLPQYLPAGGLLQQLSIASIEVTSPGERNDIASE